MSDEWGDEEVNEPRVNGDEWGNEDAEEEEFDDWDDEEDGDEEPKKEVVKKETEQPKSKAAVPPKKQKKKVVVDSLALANAKPLTTAERKLLEKKQAQEQVDDLFGAEFQVEDEPEANDPGAGKVTVVTQGSIDDYKLNKLGEYESLAQDIAKRFKKNNSKNDHIVGFLKVLLKDTIKDLSEPQLKIVHGVVNTEYNIKKKEKLAVEKQLKKKKGKNVGIKMERTDYNDPFAYDDNDYDFC